MPPRTIAIGDIHGCARALDCLLEHVQPRAEDVLVPLGDYVDRGSQSRDVIERMLELRDSCQLVPLLGNHELMMMRALQSDDQTGSWLACGGRATLASYGNDLNNVPQSHRDFLHACFRSHETSSHFFIHANYIAHLAVVDQPEWISLWEHVASTVPPPHCSGRIAVVGHTPQPNGEIWDLGHLICIDTFCVGGGWLTALDVESGQVWQTNQAGELRGPD